MRCECPKFRKRKFALIPVLYAQANHGLTREASESALAILQGYKIHLRGFRTDSLQHVTRP